MAIKVRGVKQLKSKMNAKIEGIASEVTERGIYSGLILLSGYASAATPVDTSNLANSQFVYFPTRTGSTVKGSIAYTANYADAVHEGPEKNWKRASARADFLSGEADDNKTEIWNTIKRDSQT